MKSNIKIYKFFGISIWILMFTILILDNICPTKCIVVNEILGDIVIVFFLIIQFTAIKEKFFSNS